ncbi:hypothetical protein SUGI_0603350 [Cryptomeria japonica]|nr:hypothetical protein SUGI_0603350 [Cryptomeria japonica]
MHELKEVSGYSNTFVEIERELYTLDMRIAVTIYALLSHISFVLSSDLNLYPQHVEENSRITVLFPHHECIGINEINIKKGLRLQ